MAEYAKPNTAPIAAQPIKVVGSHKNITLVLRDSGDEIRRSRPREGISRKMPKIGIE
jgi:hypothetical protein